MRLNHNARAIYDAICDELRRNGIETFQLTWRAKHPSVSFVVDGQEKWITFACTPSDPTRSAHHQRRWVRQILKGVGPRQTTGGTGP